MRHVTSMQLFILAIGSSLLAGFTTANSSKDVITLMLIQVLQMQQDNAGLQYNKVESIMNSAVLIGSSIVTLFYSFIARKIGFRKTGILGSSGSILFILLQCVPFNIYAIIIYRICQGFFMTMYMISSLSLIGELADPRQRGYLGYLFQIFFSLGILCASGVEFFISWQSKNANLWYMSFITTLPWPILGLVMLLFTKEQTDVVIQLTFKQVLNRKYLKVILPCILMGVLQQSTGINAVIIYASKELNSIVKSDKLYNYGSLIINLINFVSPIIGSFFIEYFGRKILLFTGTGICIGGQILLLLNYSLPVQSSGLLLTGAFLFIFGFEIGPGPIYYVLSTELFPEQAKSCLVSVYFLFNYLPNFFVIVLFPVLTNIAPYVPFLTYIIGMTIFSSVIVFLLPETKGKSNSEIEVLMTKQKSFYESVEAFLYFITFAVLASGLSIIILIVCKYS